MRLKGTARASELPDIFHMLASSERTGVLEVEKGGAVRRVYFGPEGVKLLFETGRSRNLLGQILIAKGVITEKTLHLALKEQKNSQRPLGEVLCDSGAARQSEVEEALTYQLREELFDLLTWEDAKFEFHEGAKEPQEAARTYLQTPSFNPNAIVMEAARRADEWKRIREVIDSEDAVLLREHDVPVSGEAAENDLALRLVELADGARTVKGLIETLRLSEFDVYASAYELLHTGAVRFASARELADRAARALDAGEFDQARALLTNAAGLCGDDLELRYQIGTMLLSSGDNPGAHQQLDIVLGRLVEEGLTDKVKEMLFHIREEFPEAPYSGERRLKLLDPKEDFREALGLAKELMAVYERLEDRDTPSRMLKHLATFSVSELKDLLAFAEFLESCGEKTYAARYYYLAGKKVAYRPSEAIRHFRKAVRLAPKYSPAREALSKMQTAPERRRRGMRRLAVFAVGVLLLAAGVFFLITRERSADETFNLAARVAERHAVRREYVKAADVYRTFSDAWPLTSSAARARRRLDEIEVDRRAYVAAKTYSLDRILSEAESAEERLDFDTALARYREIVALDISENLNRETERHIMRLSSERGTFLALIEQAQRLEAMGRYQEALLSYLHARRTSPRLYDREDVQVPLYVTSSPSRAQVLYEGRALGRTPLLLRRDAEASVDLVLTHDGHFDRTLHVPGDAAVATVRGTLIPSHSALWSVRTTGIVDEPPRAAGDVCYFSSRHGRVAAVHVTAGVKLWEHNLGTMAGAYVSAPLVLGDRLIVSTMDGTTCALTRAGGAVLWKHEGPGIVSGPPLYDASDDVVLVFYADGTVQWIDPATGNVRRRVKVPGGIAGPTLVAGDIVLAGGADRTVGAFNLASATSVWRRGTRIPVEEPLEKLGDTLLVKHDRDGLLALSVGAGKPLWTHHDEAERITAASTGSRQVYLGTSAGKLKALDARTGEVCWSTATDGAATQRPLVSGGRVYLGTADGTLSVFDANDGTLLWKTKLKGTPAATPTLVADRVLVTTINGFLEAFER